MTKREKTLKVDQCIKVNVQYCDNVIKREKNVKSGPMHKSQKNYVIMWQNEKKTLKVDQCIKAKKTKH